MIKNRYLKTAVPQYLVVIVIILGILAAGYLSTVLMKHVSFLDHFMIPWAAGRVWLLEGGNPYGEGVLQLATSTQAETQYLAVLPDKLTFEQPITGLLFYLPFSILPYEIGRAIWVTTSALMVGLIAYFSIKITGWKVKFIEGIAIILLSILWLPGFYGILSGGLTPLIIFILLFAIYSILQNQDTLGGILLSLTFSAFLSTGIVLILILIWAISRRRWSILTAFLSGIAFLIVTTYLMLPTWIMDWFRTNLDALNSFNWVQTPLLSIADLLPGISKFLSVSLHVVFGLFVVLQWITVIRKPIRNFVWKAFIVFIFAYYFQPKAAVDHLIFILPPAFFVFRFLSERWRFPGRILSWIMLALFGTGYWLLNFNSIDLSVVKLSPLLMTIAPLLIFLGMLWSHWWAVRLPTLET